ncbi:VOC family protein [Alphaproteobacteria bacterium]|nr:VOC family protein [Alphaproteobacteria bacterium]|tara:strand:- start:35 stop:403 length:369 start_codon:yes stop_codon:yes gene_type:complete
MLAYITLGTNDTQKARDLYGPLFEELGAKELFTTGRLYFYGTGMDKPMIALGAPYDAGTATFGNGTMAAIPVGSRENVDKIYAKALQLGFTDDGAPGERMPTFYGAYVRDADGNKLVFCHMT